MKKLTEYSFRHNEVDCVVRMETSDRRYHENEELFTVLARVRPEAPCRDEILGSERDIIANVRNHVRMLRVEVGSEGDKQPVNYAEVFQRQWHIGIQKRVDMRDHTCWNEEYAMTKARELADAISSGTLLNNTLENTTENK